MLEVRNLRAGYQNLEVLHGVDLKVPSGRTVALLGANGAGKTTLLNAIAGLVPATAGDVLVDGRSVLADRVHLRARDGRPGIRSAGAPQARDARWPPPCSLRPHVLRRRR